MMKIRLMLVLAGAALPFVLHAADTPSVTTVFIDPDSPDVAEIRSLGERAISRIGSTMVSEATTAVARDGAVRALSKCHLKEVTMTNGMVGGMPRIVAMKRTSLKLRSLDNAPDPADQLALDRVKVAINAGDAPKLLVQRIDLANGQHEWRVYRPLGMAKVCAACHGPANEQSPQLQAALQEKFPTDEAVGYEVGEWRGLLRVTVAEAPPPAPAASVQPTAPAARPAKKA
jgi:hypothetical protein